jgi:hypothetical protein
MSGEATKYYAFTCCLGGKPVPIAIWNGLQDYENHPPRELIASMPGKVVIAQISIPMGAGRSATKTAAGLAKCHDAIVLWARDRTVYRSLVDSMLAGSQYQQ